MVTRSRRLVIVGIWVPLLIACPTQAGELADLAKAGDLAGVTALLDRGASVDELDGGVSALYIAAETGNAGLARLLLGRGADANLTVKLQRTPLYGAIKAGHADLVGILLEGGADPNKRAKTQTPLHVAADAGCLQCVVDLVEAGAEVNALLESGPPPIHFAKRNGHEDIAAYLLEHGAGPEPSAPITPLLASADIGAGKQIFEDSCVACHIATSEAEDSKRPNLWGVVGRPKASESDVDYSPVLAAAGGTWTYEELNAFLSHPMLTLPGTGMSFVGLPDERQRADLIAYLRTLSEAPVPLP